jgi:hypothetical protein
MTQATLEKTLGIGLPCMPSAFVKWHKLNNLTTTFDKYSIKALKSQYLITDIVGHSDIAPGRKTDPGDTFNWSKIK